MKKRKSILAAINTEGWMMSYADMATILLAMFIVLSTLGKDQTGASLQKGLESWHESRQTFGLNGLFSGSALPVKQGQVGPHYTLEGSAETHKKPGEPPGTRHTDDEEALMQRFLKEMQRPFQVEKLPQVIGQATVDFYDAPDKKPPYWQPAQRETIGQLIPLLRRGDYELTLIVWATMAKDSSLTRAAETAKTLGDDLLATARLGSPARPAILAMAKTWGYRDFDRPALSFIITRTTKGSGQ